jgi:hypothetical protein
MREQTRVLTALAAVAAGAVLTMAPPASAATATTTTLVSSANPSTAGQAVTLTSTVTGVDVPGGQVEFVDSGVPLGSATLDAGVATLVVGSLSVGDHALTATYVGDGTNDPSSGTLTQTVPATPPPATPPATPVATVKPPKVKLVASTTKASVGDMVKLTWHSKRADVVMASGDWAGSQKSKGSAMIRIAERGKHVFKLTVKNASGAKSATVKVMAARKAKTLELVVTEELTLVGSEVDVTADGLAKGEEYTVRLNNKPILTGKADKHGDVARTFELAESTPEGALPLTITGSNPGRVGTAVLNVIKPKTFEVSVAQEEIVQRDDQVITVVGLLPGEAYTVTSGGKKLTSGKADATGSFTYTFKVGKPLGKRTVKVTGAIPERTGTATFTVLDPGRGPNNGG